MILPYFVERTSVYLIRKWGGRSEAVTNSLAIILAVFVIFLAICSVTTVVHNQGTPEQYCTTVLGEKTDCNKD